MTTQASPLAPDLDAILAAAGPYWDELRGGRLFVTGGTGFFGKWLLESFCWANRRLGLGAEATILTRDVTRLLASAPNLAQAPEFTFIEGDVRHFEFPKGSFSHVIHGATTSAEETFNGEPPLSKIDTTVWGTRRVLDFAVQGGVGKLLLLSSGNAYGPMPSGKAAFSETDLNGPDLENPVGSALGEAKRVSELMTRVYADKYGFEAKICRCFAFLGPYLPLEIHYAIGNFIRDGMLGRPITVQGDGSPIRSWMYMSDLMEWLWLLLFKGTGNRLYNIGSDEYVTIGEAAAMVAEETGSRVTYLNIRESRATASPSIYVPDISRISAELGVKRKVDLRSGIRKTLDYLRHA